MAFAALAVREAKAVAGHASRITWHANVIGSVGIVSGRT
jgi:hypothetical protein